MITAIFFIFVNNIYHFLQSSNNFAALYYNEQNHIYFIKGVRENEKSITHMQQSYRKGILADGQG